MNNDIILFFCPKCRKIQEYVMGLYGPHCSVCGYEGFIKKELKEILDRKNNEEEK